MEDTNKESKQSTLNDMQTNDTNRNYYYYTNSSTSLEKSFPTCAYKFVTIVRRQTVEIANKKFHRNNSASVTPEDNTSISYPVQIPSTTKSKTEPPTGKIKKRKGRRRRTEQLITQNCSDSNQIPLTTITTENHSDKLNQPHNNNKSDNIPTTPDSNQNLPSNYQTIQTTPSFDLDPEPEENRSRRTESPRPNPSPRRPAINFKYIYNCLYNLYFFFCVLVIIWLIIQISNILIVQVYEKCGEMPLCLEYLFEYFATSTDKTVNNGWITM